MSDFSFQFTMRSLLPIFVGIFFGVAYLWSLLIKRLLIRHVGAPGFRGSLAKGMALRPTINAYGTLMYTFSIAILAMAFDLFKCFEHPNKLESMRVAPDVLCYKDTWNGLLIVGIASILVYVVGSLALFSWVCWQAPKRFDDEQFRMMWKFLLVKWRPNKWWFGQFFLCKGVFLTLPLVIFQSGALQTFWAALVFESYLVAILLWYPWRHEKSNTLDLCTTAALLGLVLTCMYFTDKTDEAEAGLEKFTFIFTLLPILAFGVTVLSMARLFLHFDASPMVQSTRLAAEAMERIQTLSNMGPLHVMKGIVNLTQFEMRLLLECLEMLLIEANCTPGVRNRLVQRLAVDKKGRETGDSDDVVEEAEDWSALVSLKEHTDSVGNGIIDRKTLLKLDIYEQGAADTEVTNAIRKSASKLLKTESEGSERRRSLSRVSEHPTEDSKPCSNLSEASAHKESEPVVEELQVQILAPPSASVYSLLKPTGVTMSSAARKDIFTSRGMETCSKPRGRAGPDIELPKTTDVPLPYNWDL